MKIWKFNASEVGFSSFYFPEEDDIESFVELIDSISENPSSIKEVWKPIVMLKDKQRIDPDFFELYDTGAIVISDKGKELVEKTLEEESFELLPFLNDERAYYLLNLLRFNSKALDKDKSYFEEFLNGTISEYDLLFFSYNAVIKTPLFKIPELPYEFFVTYIFQQGYEEMDLKGINFGYDDLVFTD